MNNKLFRTAAALVIILSSLSVSLYSQDLVYSQFLNAPLVLNPAMTGNINGNHRASLIHRNQWSNALGQDSYKSTSLAFDTRLKGKDSDYFGVGVLGTIERAGALDFSVNKFAIVGSYSKTLFQNEKVCHSFQAGIDLAIVNRSIDTLNARWPSQHDGSGGFDPTLPGGIVENTSFLHGDIGLGLMWSSNFSNGASFNIGASFNHINEPNVSFLGNEANLQSRTTIHGSFNYPASSLLTIGPSFMFQKQSNHEDAYYGLLSSWSLSNDSQSFLELGFWINDDIGTTTISDNYVIYGAYNFNRIKLGYSYIIEGQFQSDDSFEIFLQYTFDTDSKLCGR